MELTAYLKQTIDKAAHIALTDRSEFLCPEHVLMALLLDPKFVGNVLPQRDEAVLMIEKLRTYLSQQERVPAKKRYELTGSVQMNEMMSGAFQAAMGASAPAVDVTHVLCSMSEIEDSMASTVLMAAFMGDRSALLAQIVQAYGTQTADPDTEEEGQMAPWLQFVIPMSDQLLGRVPLVGRTEEMERTLQILCRASKNNPLFVGEHGVGKTAMAWGLVQRIASGRVPRRLKKARVYALNIAALMAGAQFRGDIEKRLNLIMQGLCSEGNAILYIDELHALINTGQHGDMGIDVTQLLRPYLEEDAVRIVASTTHADYEHKVGRRSSVARYFMQVELPEPSASDTLRILQGLETLYSDYHRVTYAPEALQAAVDLSQKYITGRCLPDKAIDLLDEAGAYREQHPKRGGQQLVDADLVRQMVARVAKIRADVLKNESNDKLQTLTDRIASQIFGQDEAVRQVVAGVELAKAGLLDDDKPMASLLFVGPTGVGKTEVARVLAKELGVELVRFDMSEYTEKHTVAKLIGSPAGYVGYDDGGLLTDAIRKNPNCVLLLDELEKAHPDVYNILLQVMDHAQLTDSHGQKADFRQTVIIMTSNAGAQYAGQAAVGFAGGVSKGDAMLAQVKKTFKPEFINRLSGTVVFNEMDQAMAMRILDKKVSQLQDKLKARNVKLTLAKEAREWLLKRGFTPQYGAREMDRVIRQHLTPLLMQEILYGNLKEGGKVKAVVVDDQIAIK